MANYRWAGELENCGGGNVVIIDIMNANNPANSTITEEPRLTRNALKDFQHSLKEIYGQAPLMRVYGSQARKEATPASDIDVLLIYPHSINPGSEITRLSGILADLNLRYQVLISILPVSQSDYQKLDSPLMKNIRNEGVSIDSF